MATVDALRPRAQTEPTTRDTCRLTLQIDATVYRVRPDPSPSPFASVKAFRLREPGGGATYTVARTLAGNVCDCDGFRASHVNSLSDCEHIRALIAVGLLDRDSPRDRPGLAPGADLADRADREADAYRALGTPEGDLFARALAELAKDIRMTRAETPEEFAARIEVLDAGLRELWEDRAYEMGRRSACRCRENAPE